MGHNEAATEVAKIRAERDLYMRLLELGQHGEIEVVLRDGLRLIAEIADARQGYLELYDEDDPTGEPRWCIAYGLSNEQVVEVRSAISDGIIAEALATGETIVTRSAFSDPRFNARASIQRKHIEAVLCAPIGEDPPCGALYLQGPSQSDVFSVEGRLRAETFARHLAPVVRRLLAKHDDTDVADPTAALRRTLRVDGVIGRSQALASVLRQIALAAPLDVTVLLTGDSGTGKSQIARVLHDNSPRSGSQFIEVSCGNLPDSLIESELFGAMPGAHSTAIRRVEGKVAAAEGGTLFLDEVSNLSSIAQSKLLQLLQSKEYYPLGSPKPVHADVRVVTATNTDLERAVADGKFREDLFYRLHVLPVRVPSLGERREDIRALTLHFCAESSRRHNLAPLSVSRNAIRAAQAVPWPGNIRQLMNAVEVATIRAAAEGATQVEVKHLFPTTEEHPDSDDGPLTLQEATRRFQRGLLLETLEETDWNVLEAGRRLDITRSHVYNLVRAFGLDRRLRDDFKI